MARSSRFFRGSVLAGSVSLALLTGCTASRDARYRSMPTPELDTLYQRPVDVKNTLAIMDDENWRMFVQDLGRAFYTDRPSRLTREPIPHP